MEKFDHQEYRDNLAKDLKSITDHDERAKALEMEKKSFRYNKAKDEHIRDVQEKLEGVGIDPLKTFPKFFKDPVMKTLLEEGRYDQHISTDNLEIETIPRSRINFFDTENYHVLLIDYYVARKHDVLNRYDKKVLRAIFRRKDSFKEEEKTEEYWVQGNHPRNVDYEDWTHPLLDVDVIEQDSFMVQIKAQSDNRSLEQSFFFHLSEKNGVQEVK